MDLHILCSLCFLNPILSTSDECDDSHFIDKDFQYSQNLEVLGLGIRVSCLQTPGPLYNIRRETGRRNGIDKGRRLEGVGI